MGQNICVYFLEKSFPTPPTCWKIIFSKFLQMIFFSFYLAKSLKINKKEFSEFEDFDFSKFNFLQLHEEH